MSVSACLPTLMGKIKYKLVGWQTIYGPVVTLSPGLSSSTFLLIRETLWIEATLGFIGSGVTFLPVALLGAFLAGLAC